LRGLKKGVSYLRPSKLVLVYVSTDDGRTVPVPLEYRALGWLLEGEGCRPDELVGRRIRCDGDRIRFLDRECSR
jgi:hypothetical protein